MPYTQALLSAVPVPDPGVQARAHRAHGRRPVAGESAVGLRVPSALPASGARTRRARRSSRRSRRRRRATGPRASSSRRRRVTWDAQQRGRRHQPARVLSPVPRCIAPSHHRTPDLDDRHGHRQPRCRQRAARHRRRAAAVRHERPRLLRPPARPRRRSSSPRCGSGSRTTGSARCSSCS